MPTIPHQSLSVLTILINHKTKQKYEKKQLCRRGSCAFPAMENFPDYETTNCVYPRISDTITCHCIAGANRAFEPSFRKQFVKRSASNTRRSDRFFVCL